MGRITQRVLVVSVLGLIACSSGNDTNLITPHNDSVPTLLVPVIKQVTLDERFNCGPTAAAMMLGSYGNWSQDHTEEVRNQIGELTWKQDPIRHLETPEVKIGEWSLLKGGQKGATTPLTMVVSLNAFSPGPSFKVTNFHSNPIGKLHQLLLEKKPVLVLVHASDFWDNDSSALHWIVVKGVVNGNLIVNDPGDTGDGEVQIEPERFHRAWDLRFPYSNYLGSFVAIVANEPLPDITCRVALK